MKVIFIEDVPNVARAGETRVVANGYARNYLLPQKLAVLANSQAAATVESHLKKVAKKRAIEEAEMAELAKAINGTEITLTAKVGENERLYGSVTGANIAEELGKTIGREVDKRKIELAEPIRQVGIYDVMVRFTHDITAMVSVTVMSDEPGAARPARPEAVEETVEAREEKAGEAAVEKAAKKEKTPREKKTKTAKEEGAEETEKAEKKEKKTKAKTEKKAKKEADTSGEEKVKAEEKSVKEAETETEEEVKES